MPLPIVNLGIIIRNVTCCEVTGTERQRHIIYVNVGMFNYCFITVSDYMLVFVMVFVSRFRRVAWGMWWPAIG